METAHSLSEGGMGSRIAILEFVPLLLLMLFLVGSWKTFVKAGYPGWIILVPLYNLYVLCEIAGRPGWWCLLFLIPVVGLIVAFIVCIDLARQFGKGVGFGLGLLLFGYVFFPIMGFGNARYRGAAR